MRVQKYRAWSHMAKKMYEVTSLDFYTAGVTDIAVKTGQAPNGIMYSAVCEPDGLELMQYIGEQDRHDREEYEGDIIDYLDNTSQGLVKKRVVIADIRHLPDFTCSKWEEIIGNIYANPELVPDTIDERQGEKT